MTGELSTLIYPEIPVLKVGPKDKVKSARKDIFEFVQQTRVPDSVELLSLAILSLLKGRGNSIGGAETLLNSRVKGMAPVGAWVVGRFIGFRNKFDYRTIL